MGQSPIQKLQPYFGQKVQFPLTTSIPVKKGYVVGAHGADLGAGADAAARRRVVLAGEPPQGQVRQDRRTQTAQTEIGSSAPSTAACTARG